MDAMIKEMRAQIRVSEKSEWHLSNELFEELGKYVGKLKILHPKHRETIEQIEESAIKFYQAQTRETSSVGQLRMANLFIAKVSELIQVGETLNKEQEKILPDYKELTNDIKKIRNDYDTMDGLFEEFKGMKDKLKKIIEEYDQREKLR